MARREVKRIASTDEEVHRSSGRRVGDRHIQDMLRWRRRGVSVGEISRRLETTRQTISNRLRQIELLTGESLRPGVPSRKHDRVRIEKDIDARKADGTRLYTYREIAEAHGCSRSFVGRLANGKIRP